MGSISRLFSPRNLYSYPLPDPKTLFPPFPPLLEMLAFLAQEAAFLSAFSPTKGQQLHEVTRDRILPLLSEILGVLDSFRSI